MLARRTRKLINELKPDHVFVMCSPQWWESARLIQGVHSQEDFDQYYDDVLKNISEFEVDTSHFRGAVFGARMWILKNTLRAVYRFGNHFRFYEPGLEIKYACEEAEKLGAQLHFLGPELNNITWHRLYHDTRFNLPYTLARMWQFSGTRWSAEARDHIKKLQMTTPSQYAETCCDSYNINWYIKNIEMLFPNLKYI